MNVQSFLPQHPLLQKHIDFYYFFTSQDPGFDTTYLSFPNLYTPLNIHRNADAAISPYSTSVYESPDYRYRTIIQGMREYPLRVRLKGRLDKCTIAFKPLGINHFIDQHFIDIAPKDSQLFTGWETFPQYPGFLHTFYATEDLQQRVATLESFLLAHYRTINLSDRLEKAIHKLTGFDQRFSISDIAEDTGMHLRSFNREFRKHLGISPVGFRNIARFRHSLTNGLFNGHFRSNQSRSNQSRSSQSHSNQPRSSQSRTGQQPHDRSTTGHSIFDRPLKLTDIAYASDFYDQSYFISIYKKMTGSSPKKFFREIESVGDDRILFQFVNK